jgi:cold shock CspA family protein
MPRVAGVVKLFIDIKRRADGTEGGGYGFIVVPELGDEFFVHRSDLGASCLQEVSGRSAYLLLAGQKVTFEIATTSKGNGKKAAKVELTP